MWASGNGKNLKTLEDRPDTEASKRKSLSAKTGHRKELQRSDACHQTHGLQFSELPGSRPDPVPINGKATLDKQRRLEILMLKEL